MTLADKIRAYARDNPNHSSRQIADHFHTSVEYVRVCSRQRVSGPSLADRRYNATPKGNANRVVHNIVKRLLDRKHPDLARAETEAIRAVKAEGLDNRAADRAASAVQRRVIRLTKGSQRKRILKPRRQAHEPRAD